MTSVRQAKRISQLLPHNRVGNNIIKSNDNNRVIGVNEDIIILCTKTEYKIIMMLLQQRPITDHALISDIFHCAPDALTLKNLGKHIEHLREKLRGTGLEIRRIHAYGYLLVELME